MGSRSGGSGVRSGGRLRSGARAGSPRPGDLVRFKNPTSDEKNLVMRVVEVNGDRILVEYQVGMNINPTQTIAANEIKIK